MTQVKGATELNKIIEDLTGQKILGSVSIPESVIDRLRSKSSRGLGHSQFNELLLYLNYNRVSHAFFQFLVDQTTEYKSGASIKTLAQFRTSVDEFRKVALLFSGNVRYAFKKMSRDASFLEQHLTLFDRRREKNFKSRHAQIIPPKLIDGKDTYYLGYVVQHELAAKLRESPTDSKALEPGAPSLSMARQDFPVPLAPFGYGAYSACGFAFGRPRSPCGPAYTAGPQWLDASRSSATADYAPSLRSPWRAAEEKRRKDIVEKGKQNHDAYLVSDHLDVYIATSMRERHEYLMVNKTTRAIFSHPALNKLKLRYFDPTQAYCMDRIDKSLAEALMLKRAKCTIYFAQESDTIGKDSELASTLAQGKPVIAYVPRPRKNAARKLIDLLSPFGSDYQQIILRQLQIQDPDAAWNDPQVKKWISNPKGLTRNKGIARLQVAMVKQFNKRDKLLREIHPLGIQVNLGSGVANGVLVVNTVAQCAKLIRGMLLRELNFDLETEKKDSGEYLFLRERISKSIFRVVTGDVLLTNAFWNFYLTPSE